VTTPQTPLSAVEDIPAEEVAEEVAEAAAVAMEGMEGETLTIQTNHIAKIVYKETPLNTSMETATKVKDSWLNGTFTRE
jgi:hypothetical protein